MKKLLVMVIALVLIFSIGAIAKEERTQLEERWDFFFETADLRYEQNEGRFESYAYLDGFMTGDGDSLGDTNLVKNIGLDYGIYKNMELSLGYNDTFVLYDTYYYENWYYDEGDINTYSGEVKAVVFNTDSSKVAVKAGINYKNATYYEYETIWTDYGTDYQKIATVRKQATGGFDLYYNQAINKQITLYNHYGLTMGKSGLFHQLTGGVQYESDQLSVKGFIDTAFQNLNNNLILVGGAVKSQVSDETVCMLEASKILDSDFYEIILRSDYHASPTQLVTSSFTLSSTFDPVIELGLEKKLGVFTFSTGFDQSLSSKYVSMTGIKAGMDFTLFDHLNFTIDAKNTLGIYDGEIVAIGIYGFAGLSYDFF